MLSNKITNPITMDKASGLSSVSKYRLTKMDGANENTFTYCGDGEKNAFGATDSGLSAANVTSGFTECAINPLVPGSVLELEAHEAIAVNQPFTCAALGRIKNITTNATPEAQFAYGFARQAANAQGDIISCYVLPGENYVK